MRKYEEDLGDGYYGMAGTLVLIQGRREFTVRASSPGYPLPPSAGEGGLLLLVPSLLGFEHVASEVMLGNQRNIVGPVSLPGNDEGGREGRGRGGGKGRGYYY